MPGNLAACCGIDAAIARGGENRPRNSMVYQQRNSVATGNRQNISYHAHGRTTTPPRNISHHASKHNAMAYGSIVAGMSWHLAENGEKSHQQIASAKAISGVKSGGNKAWRQRQQRASTLSKASRITCYAARIRMALCALHHARAYAHNNSALAPNINAHHNRRVSWRSISTTYSVTRAGGGGALANNGVSGVIGKIIGNIM